MANLLSTISSEEITEWIAVYALEAEEIERQREEAKRRR